MEELMKQTRLRVPSKGQGIQAEPISTTEKTVLPRQKTYREEGIEEQHTFSQEMSRQMMQDSFFKDDELVTAVAAAAFSIHSLEDAEMQYLRKRREGLESSKSRIKSTKQASMSRKPNSAQVTRRLSSKEPKNAGEASKKNSMGPEKKANERVVSLRPTASINDNQRPRIVSPRLNGLERKADSWERVQMEKIRKRCENMIAAIIAWENQRKMKVKIRMEKKKRELEQRRQRNQQYYQNKLARIDQIARGAMAQVEEKKKKEESMVKERSKRMRITGKAPVKCLCFYF